MACTLAESLNDPLHRKFRQLRCLRCRFDCYRVERTSSRAGVSPAEVQRLSRRTFSPTMNYDGRRCNSIHRVNTFGIAQDSVASAPKEKLEETIRKVKEKTGE